jgi:hypothetical protein
LHYAVKASGKAAWQTTVVDDTGTDTGWFPDLAIDAADTLHISYGNHANDTELLQKLMHAYQPAGGAWQSEDSGAGRGGWWTACGTSGTIFIASHTKLPPSGVDETKMQVVYKNGADWTYQDVDTSYDSGWFTDLTVTPDHQPAVIYGVGYFGGFLKLAVFDGTEWTITQIDEGYYGGSVAADADGYFHIAYSKEDPVNSDFWELWYATNAPPDIGPRSPDPGEDTSRHRRLPEPGDRRPGAAGMWSTAISGDALKYARHLGDGREITVADRSAASLYTSAALDDAAACSLLENGPVDPVRGQRRLRADEKGIVNTHL